MNLRTYLKLAACLAVPLAVGALAGIATSNGVNGWYTTIAKPTFTPPNFLFPIVWTLLYVLMGVSLFMLLQAPRSRERGRAALAFGVQLALNFAWSFVFFYFHCVGLSLVIIVLLWLAIGLMILSASCVRKPAAYLQVPYLLWVTFASILNTAIYLLN